MNVRLVVAQGKRRKVFPMKTHQAVLGRARGNAIRIPSSQVSRQHCRLRQDNGLVYLEDLGSVNGTFLNGRRVEEPEVVRPGDKLEVGPVTFLVEYEMSAEALDRLMSESLDAAAEQGNMLEGLADGELLEEVSEPYEPVELELDLEPAAPPRGKTGNKKPGAKGPPEIPAKAKGREERKPARPSDDSGPIEPDFDFDAPWAMPASGDLRDLLEQMEDSDELGL